MDLGGCLRLNKVVSWMIYRFCPGRVLSLGVGWEYRSRVPERGELKGMFERGIRTVLPKEEEGGWEGFYGTQRDERV